MGAYWAPAAHSQRLVPGALGEPAACVCHHVRVAPCSCSVHERSPPLCILPCPRLPRSSTAFHAGRRWAAADQLLFNTSGAYLTPPLLTQPFERGAHVEHSMYKRQAREFAFGRWHGRWRALSQRVDLTRVHVVLYTVGANGNASAGCVESIGSSASHASGSSSAHLHRMKSASGKQHGLLEPRAAKSPRPGCALGSVGGDGQAGSAGRRKRVGLRAAANALGRASRQAGRMASRPVVPKASSAPLLDGLPAHTQVLGASLDGAVEQALALAAARLLPNGSLPAGVPPFALVLPLPLLLLRQLAGADQRAAASVAREERGGGRRKRTTVAGHTTLIEGGEWMDATADALTRASLLLIGRASATSNTSAEAPVPWSADVTMLMLHSSPRLPATDRKSVV